MDKNIRVTPWPPFKRSGTTITQRTANDNVDLLAGSIHANDDTVVKLGNTLASPDAQILWETADSDANELIISLPEGGATNVPVVVIGDTTLLNKNLGLFNGVTAPTVAVVDGGATKATYIQHNGTDGILKTSSGNLTIDVAGDIIQTADNKDNLALNIPVSGTDATAHMMTFQIAGLPFLYASATGDTAGGIGVITINLGVATAADIVHIGDANALIDITDAHWSITDAGLGSFVGVAAGGAITTATTLALSQGITQTTTVVGTLYDMVLETEWTGGTLINADFGGATVQATDMLGMVLDFNTNMAGVTDKDVTGYTVKTPTLTQGDANTTTYTGYNLPTAGALVQSAGAGTIAWKGVNLIMPNTTQTAGTVTATGLSITGGTQTSGTQKGIDITMAAAANTAIYVATGTIDFNSNAVNNVGNAGNDFGTTNSLVGTTFSGTVDFNGNSVVNVGNAGNDFGATNALMPTTFSGDVTFASTFGIRSGVTNGDTLIIASNDTTFITITSGATDTCVLASAVTATTQAAGNNSTLLATTAYVDAAVGTVNSFAEILALSNITGTNNIVVSTTQSINTALADDNYFTIKAVDNDDDTAYEVARAQGAADPYFSVGGTQQFKFYKSGVAAFAGAATGVAFIDISPTLTGVGTTNTYAVNISPVGITIPTAQTVAIAASLYVAEPIFTEDGTLTLGANVYIDAAPTEGATNYSLYVVGTTYATGAITAFGGVTGTLTGDCTGNAGTVTNGVYTNGVGVVTAKMLQNAAADLGAADISIVLSNTNSTYVTNLTIDGAFSGLTYNGLTITANGTNTLNIAAGQTLTVSGSATITGALGTGAYATIADYAPVGQQFYIGSTQVAINRATNPLTLAGITLTTPDIGTPSAGTLTNCTGYAADINLPKGKQINLTLPDTDATCTGNVSSSWPSAYTSSAIGDLVFFNGTEWAKTDSDAVATCKCLLGIALEVKADGVAMKVALPGSMVHLDAWNWTPGATLYVGDDTAGTMEETIPTGADAIIRVVGFAMDADTVFFMPSSDSQSTVA